MNNTMYPIAVIGVIAAVTWALRAFPFLLFGNRPLPKVIRYLGKALPPAIMTILVIYCLRDISFGQSPFGIPELAACALVVILQVVRKKYVSVDYCRNRMLYDPDSHHVTNLFRTVNEQINRDLNRVVCCSKNVIGEAENVIIWSFPGTWLFNVPGLLQSRAPQVPAVIDER